MYINNQNRCIGCMEPLGEGNVCGECGLDQETYNPIPRCLRPGTMLAGRYVTGRVLGEGAFGITYIGWDTILEMPVAIKEYFPYNVVSRDVICGSGNQVYIYENEKKKNYEKQLEKFLEEAKLLSRLNEIDGIVSVRDFFYENSTAYIVMQYIRGMKVKALVEKNGRVSGEKVMEMFQPVLLAMEQVHGVGIIHRDISPDNIMINENGDLIMIDFGAARMRNIDVTKTMTVMFKRGFSPEEQYRYKGRWGGYTDVYSICATMYYMLTAQVPMDSVLREVKDELPPLSSMRNVKLPAAQKDAIMKGMSVHAGDRYQSMRELYDALYQQQADGQADTSRKKSVAKIAAIPLLAGVILLGGASVKSDEAEPVPGTKQETAAPQPQKEEPAGKPETMPLLTGMTKEQAGKICAAIGVRTAITWKNKYSGTVKKGRVLSQSIPAGQTISGGDRAVSLTLVVSRGVKKVKVPRLTGIMIEEAKRLLAERGLKCKTAREPGAQEKGTVVAQGTAYGKKVKKGTCIRLTLSDGSRKQASRSGETETTGKKRGESDTGSDFVGVIQ